MASKACKRLLNENPRQTSYLDFSGRKIEITSLTWIFRLFADEICGVIRIAAALVGGDLRMRAYRTRHRHAGVGSLPDDRGRGCPLFAPLFQGAHPVDLVRPGASAAVAHSWNHEQLQPVVLILSHPGDDAVVVIHRVLGLNGGIGPAV